MEVGEKNGSNCNIAIIFGTILYRCSSAKYRNIYLFNIMTNIFSYDGTYVYSDNIASEVHKMAQDLFLVFAVEIGKKVS